MLPMSLLGAQTVLDDLAANLQVRSSRALTNLRRELHHLRQVLGDEASLVVTARELCWRDPATGRSTRRRVQLQPLEETGYRTLMEPQAERGDRAGAVSTYHHCASRHWTRSSPTTAS